MKNRRILVVSILMFFIISALKPCIFATNASVSLSASSTQPTVGESVTVTASAVAGAFNLKLSGNGETKQIVGQTDITDNVSKSTSITFTPTEAKSYTFRLTGDYTDFYKEQATTVDKTVTINVKAKATEKPANTSTTQTPTTQTPATTTQKPASEQATAEPNFTSANKTMYATGDINLRSSWSTSSAATKIKKGTELKVTATSTKTVNGYVWYRVSYNGQTKYVASGLLTSTKPEDETKSNNSNLKALSIEGATILPTFSPSVTSYTVQVAKDIQKLNVNAVAEDEKATISIKGNEQLKEGENLITVSVSAEDGTVKIYEINVERLPEETIVLGLKTLKIDGTDIDKRFKTDVYNYEIKVEEDVSRLKIEAIPNDETATVEILGNDELFEGENIITIMVSSQGGNEKITYQIKANKDIKAVPLVNTEEETNIFPPKVLMYIGAGLAVVIALIIVVAYTIKHRNQEQYNDFNFDDFENNSLENKNDEISDINNTQEINNTSENEIETQQENEDTQNKKDYNFENKERSRRRKGKHF